MGVCVAVCVGVMSQKRGSSYRQRLQIRRFNRAQSIKPKVTSQHLLDISLAANYSSAVYFLFPLCSLTRRIIATSLWTPPRQKVKLFWWSVCIIHIQFPRNRHEKNEDTVHRIMHVNTALNCLHNYDVYIFLLINVFIWRRGSPPLAGPWEDNQQKP